MSVSHLAATLGQQDRVDQLWELRRRGGADDERWFACKQRGRFLGMFRSGGQHNAVGIDRNHKVLDALPHLNGKRPRLVALHSATFDWSKHSSHWQKGCKWTGGVRKNDRRALGHAPVVS